MSTSRSREICYHKYVGPQKATCTITSDSFVSSCTTPSHFISRAEKRAPRTQEVVWCQWAVESVKTRPQDSNLCPKTALNSLNQLWNLKLICRMMWDFRLKALRGQQGSMEAGVLNFLVAL